MQQLKSIHANGSPTGTEDARRYSGVVAALFTPCREPGVPDPEAMRSLSQHVSSSGCDGLFVISSTGEMPLLGGEQRQALIAAAREGAGQATLYAGVSGLGIDQTIRHMTEAADAGADVAIAMAPFFLKLDQQELLAYFSILAEASPIPMGLYHHLRMPSVIEPETVARLAEHPNMVVIKDTSTDIARMRTLAQAVPTEKLTLMQGRESLLLQSLNAGASGCVTALAAVVPEWHRDLIAAWRTGDASAAQHAQQRITALAAIFQLPQVGRSFAHFAYALRRIAWQRHWINCTDGMVPGFAPDPAFDQAIDQMFESIRGSSSLRAFMDAVIAPDATAIEERPPKIEHV